MPSGWHRPRAARSDHYFTVGSAGHVSACGRWEIKAPTELHGPQSGVDQCGICRRVIAKRMETAHA